MTKLSREINPFGVDIVLTAGRRERIEYARETVYNPDTGDLSVATYRAITDAERREFVEAAAAAPRLRQGGGSAGGRPAPSRQVRRRPVGVVRREPGRVVSDPMLVGTRDLRRALLAVLPHADTFDESPAHRVRFEVGDVNLTITATDRYSSVALAIVSIHDAGELGGAVFDLAPDEVKKILAVHKPRRGNRSAEDDLDSEEILALQLTGRDDVSLETRDVSGLFPGDEALTVPTLTLADNFPDVAGYLGESAHTHEVQGVAYEGAPLAVFPPRLATFHAASKAYGKALALRLVARSAGLGAAPRFALLVTVGDSFIGLVRLEHPDVEKDVHPEVFAAWHGWLVRLPSKATRPWESSPTSDTTTDDGEDEDGDDPPEPDDTPPVEWHLQPV